MSRLIVKNLPNQVTVDKLKNIFSEKGEVTDVQLKYTKEGKFRNFGFVGFKSEVQANAAREHFNGSCVQTKRIVVEACAALGSSAKPQAWSKYAPDSSAFRAANEPVPSLPSQSDKDDKKEAKRRKKGDKIKRILERHKDDPLFAEFMQVHASTLDKAAWSNDNVVKNLDDDAPEQENDEIREEKVSEESQKVEDDKLAHRKITDLEYMKSLMAKSKSNSKTEATDNFENDEPKKKKKTPQNRVLFTVKIRGLPFSCKKKDIKDFFRPLIPFTIRIPRCQTKMMKGFCYVGFRTEDERKKALFKNRSFLGGHHVNVDTYDNQRKVDNVEDQQEEENPKHKNQEEALKHEESIAESGRIYVRNLPYIVTEDEVQELFEKFGPIAEMNLPVDKITHQAKGFGLVTFMMPEHAVKAYTELDGSVFCGRMLHLLPGKQKDNADGDEENLTFKQKKEKKQRAQSGSAHNWNTLFLGANAVADVIASNYDTTKAKLLDSNSKTSAAVKLALGETQLVMNTRKFMEENGICLDVFNQAPKKRSKTVILVKNLPSQTVRDELLSVFEPFGTIARLIIPPHGITALIEFVEPSEAKKAFSKLAYSKFKHLPLYLEWAPDNVFLRPAEIKTEKLPHSKEYHEVSNVESMKVENVVNKIEEKNNDDEEEDDDVPEPGTTLFVKGLNFETRDDVLRQHFEECGRIHSVTIAMKKDPHNPGKRLSMGYGFVQFYTKSSTEKALKNLQMTKLDGKQIELKRSERTGQSDVRTSKKETQMRKQTGTKILVRNVPFQANRQEIQEIFGAFGEIKALRMPRKMVPGENRHRGFCFVEYHNKSDAKKSFETLCQSTHLYGRRLVLEWAKLEDNDEMLDGLRKRTAESFNQTLPGGKKSKKAVVELEDMDAEEE